MLWEFIQGQSENYNLASPEGTIYYYLENRRVTENFVDQAALKLHRQQASRKENKR